MLIQGNAIKTRAAPSLPSKNDTHEPAIETAAVRGRMNVTNITMLPAVPLPRLGSWAYPAPITIPRDATPLPIARTVLIISRISRVLLLDFDGFE